MSRTAEHTVGRVLPYVVAVRRADRLGGARYEDRLVWAWNAADAMAQVDADAVDGTRFDRAASVEWVPVSYRTHEACGVRPFDIGDLRIDGLPV